MDQILAAHNQHRRQHCAPPLRWSPRLARVAARWARHLARAQCAFEHSPSSDYGENLFFAAPSNPNTGLEAVETWYNEHREYNFRRGRFDFRTGHFTQLVWRNTTDLGCARSRCNGGDLWVCNYHPPGNVRDHYRANVLAPSCEGAAE
jgi:uncharacterized protein YkwD